MKRVTTIRLDSEVDEALTVAAASEYRSISALLNIAARAWLVSEGYLAQDGRAFSRGDERERERRRGGATS